MTGAPQLGGELVQTAFQNIIDGLYKVKRIRVEQGYILRPLGHTGYGVNGAARKQQQHQKEVHPKHSLLHSGREVGDQRNPSPVMANT